MRAGPRRSALRRRIAVSAGPLLTLACAALTELLRPTALHLPGPGIALLVSVAVSTFMGGFVPGFVSTALAALYAAWYFGHTPPAGVTPDEMRRILDLTVGAVLLVVMLGVLRRRAARAHQLETDAAVEAEYRLVFEEAADPLLLADVTGHYVFVNRRACEMTGYTREELLRMRTGDLFERDHHTGRGGSPMTPGPAGRLHVEVDLLRRDGTRLRTELSVCRLKDGRMLKIVHDVSQLRATMDSLQSALSLVRATLESTADGILVVNNEGRWVDHNRKFRDLWRVPDEIAKTGDDRRAPEFLASQVADPDEFSARVQELYAAPEASSHDEIRMKDGRVLERDSIPQRLGNRIIGRVWTFRDVSEAHRQARALRETQKHFVQTEKLDAVGRLAGGVAHDFNNMLTAILGEADLLLLQQSLDARARGQVENIRDAALRSARLTRQLLAFSRRQQTAPLPFALGEMLEGLDPIIRRLAGRQVEVRLDLPAGGSGPWVHADPSQFEQAVLNLVINAGDAMPSGGRLVVSLCREGVGEDEVQRRGAMVAGPHACVCVEDTGTGIAPDVLPHLFEPFFTTKPPEKGTGLGLASVHGILRQSNGFVEVSSEVGRGSVFRLLLPEHATQAGDEDPGEDARAHPRPSRAESVLVADDEETVRSMVVSALAQAGYDVLHASSADAASSLAAAQAGTIDLLLTDVLMPGTDGATLARGLVAQGRVRHVMFMSGFPGGVLDDQLASLPAAVVLAKPFTATELLERVRRVLAGAETTRPG